MVVVGVVFHSESAVLLRMPPYGGIVVVQVNR